MDITNNYTKTILKKFRKCLEFWCAYMKSGDIIREVCYQAFFMWPAIQCRLHFSRKPQRILWAGMTCGELCFWERILQEGEHRLAGGNLSPEAKEIQKKTRWPVVWGRWPWEEAGWRQKASGCGRVSTQGTISRDCHLLMLILRISLSPWIIENQITSCRFSKLKTPLHMES